jgi:hypothetical protein
MNFFPFSLSRPCRATFLLAALLCAGAAFLPILSWAGTSGGTEKTVQKTSTGPDGAKLWAQVCVQCHNLRPPESFSGAQWVVIVHHMHVRARLTQAESDAILGFLKSGK